MPSDPRALFVTDAPAVGGSEVYLREVLPRLVPHGLRPAVALPAVGGTAVLRAQMQQLGLEVLAYDDLAEVRRWQDAHHPAVTLLSSWNPRGYRKYYAGLRGPFTALVHDQLMLHIPLLPQAIYRACYEVLQGGDLRAADHAITVSNWGAEYLGRHHGLKDVHAVPNGIDEHKFRPAEAAERNELRARHGFSRLTVLVPARMSIEKNHPTVLGVARAVPELDFVLVGTGYLEGPLRRLSTPNVRFLGQRTDMPELYRAADLVLQPTIAENQSLATLEALGSGVPVVTNDIPAQRELMSFGREGLLIGSGVPGYAAALRALARHEGKRLEMGRAARSRVLTGHTLAQHARMLAGLLHRLGAPHGAK